MVSGSKDRTKVSDGDEGRHRGRGWMEIGCAATGIPPPRVLGLTVYGKEVSLSDGTTRPLKEGNAYRLPDTGGDTIETINPAK